MYTIMFKLAMYPYNLFLKILCVTKSLHVIEVPESTFTSLQLPLALRKQYSIIFF